MKLPRNPFKAPFHHLRRWVVQPLFWALFFVSPWVNVFRVDMLARKIIFWGHSYPFEQQFIQWIPIGFYGGVLGIALASVLFGRIFCGWSCPHNTLTEWTRSLRAAVGREAMPIWMKRWQRNTPKGYRFFQWTSPILSILLTIALSTSLAGFVVPPFWILQQYTSGSPHIALVFGQGLFTLIGLFLLYCGHDFCRTCCPYGMGQSISAYVGRTLAAYGDCILRHRSASRLQNMHRLSADLSGGY